MRQLIATHWYPDHIGGIAGLQLATGAMAAAHLIEAAAIAGAPGLAIPHPAPARHRWLRPILWPLLTTLRPPAFPVATALDEGDWLPLLTGARVVHTPGHTPGSISLHFPAVRTSVRKLAPPAFEVICFSHFQPMRRGARGALRSLAEYVW